MSWLSGVRHRISELLRPGQADRDLQTELEEHFAQETERQVREGRSREDAARLAALRTGNLRAAREAVRDDRTGRPLRDAATDFRIALRAARRNPGFTAAVVISLALGIGGTSGVFSIVNAVLIRPLPYAEPDRLFLARIWWNDFSSTLSPADLLAVQEHAGAVVDAGGYFLPDDGFAMTTPSGPELVTGAVITPELPRVLGIAPIVGTGFTSAEPSEALISESLWRERYSAAPDAIGRPIVLNGATFTVAGVMPDSFGVPGQPGAQVWQKAVRRQPPTRRGPFYLITVVRLAPGMQADVVAERMTSIVTPVLQQRYAVEPKWRYGLRPLKTAVVGDVQSTLLLIFGAMGLVLLIAIVNVSNLLLARGMARSRELAVRASLGAARGRLARQLLVESSLLGGLGALVGGVFAWGLMRVASTAAVHMVPRLNEVRFDVTVALFVFVSGIGAGIIAGLLPSFRIPWTRLAQILRDGGRSAGQSRAHVRLRQGLVVAEVALTVTVLIGAVLLTKSLLRLEAIDPGFVPSGVATFRVSLPDSGYGTDDRVALFAANLDRELRAIPGVTSAAYAMSLPPDLLVMSNNYTVEGVTAGSAGPAGVAEWQVASPDYFQAMGVPLREGRLFDARDRAGAPDVAIVNETFARRLAADGRAIGRRFKGGDFNPAAPWTTIVGIVADVPYGKGLWGGADLTVYRPYAQNLWLTSPYVIVKSTTESASLVAPIRQAVRTVDPNLPLRDVATMTERLARSTTAPRLRSLLFALVGGLALALAVTGIYGVMAYHVQQRRRETAIRRALGAAPLAVAGATVWAGLKLAGMGLAFGLAGAFVLSRTLATMLFHVSPRDPAAFAIVAACLGSAALVACALPAFRTLRVNPASVLRDE